MTSHHKKEKDMIQNKGTGKKKMNNTQDNSERKFQELVAIKQIKSEQETKYQELRRAPIWEENETVNYLRGFSIGKLCQRLSK